MCLILKEDLEKMLSVVNDFIKNNDVANSDLKDHLADLKDAKKLDYCGCDGLFEIKENANETLVFMQLAGTLYKFVINENSYYEKAAFSEALDNYDEIVENEYLNVPISRGL